MQDSWPAIATLSLRLPSVNAHSREIYLIERNSIRKHVPDSRDSKVKRKGGKGMTEKVKASDCLVVAADFKVGEDGIEGVRKKVLALATLLKGTGVYIKVNSILRACGYELIKELHDLGVRVMADLKLVDIPKTMEFDAAFLAEYGPEIITVMANAGVDGMSAFCAELESRCGGEVLAVTILTSLDEEGCHEVYHCPTKVGVLGLSRLAQSAGCDGLVLSGKEVPIITKRSEIASALSLNTPGVRPGGEEVEGEDQDKARVVTPGIAIERGVKRVIIGRPITQADNPRAVVVKILEEIRVALEEKAKKEAEK